MPSPNGSALLMLNHECRCERAASSVESVGTNNAWWLARLAWAVATWAAREASCCSSWLIIFCSWREAGGRVESFSVSR